MQEVPKITRVPHERTSFHSIAGSTFKVDSIHFFHTRVSSAAVESCKLFLHVRMIIMHLRSDSDAQKSPPPKKRTRKVWITVFLVWNLKPSLTHFRPRNSFSSPLEIGLEMRKTFGFKPLIPRPALERINLNKPTEQKKMEQRTYFFFNNTCYEPGTLRQRAYGNNRITSKELPFFLSLALFSLFRSRKKSFQFWWDCQGRERCAYLFRSEVRRQAPSQTCSYIIPPCG